MGLFSSKTADEERLTTLCQTLGAAAGQVARGDMPVEYFSDVWSSSRAEIAELYDTVSEKKNPKAARNITKHAITWADVWGASQDRNYRASRAATELVRDALSKTVSGPIG